MFCIYCLLSEQKNKTYVGFSDDLETRILSHLNKKVKSTKNFGNFNYFILEENIINAQSARERERYWKSCTGRKKIKELIF